MLPFSGQGATQAIEDAGAISILFQDLSSAEDLPARLALFEKVRTKRASRIQVVSKVRVGKEEEIAEELKRYLEDGMVGMFPWLSMWWWWYGGVVKLTVCSS